MTSEPEMNELQVATEQVREGCTLHCFHYLKGKQQIQRGGGGCLELAHVSLTCDSLEAVRTLEEVV